MTRAISAIALLFTICVLSPSAGHAQVCFNGKPLPECKSFWVTEFTYGKGIGNDDHLLSLDLGMMVNLNEKHAVGGSCYGDLLIGSGKQDDYHLGLKGRYRYWMNSTLSIDADIGATITSPHLAIIDLDLFYKNWIGVGGRAVFWPDTDYQDSETVFYGTFKIGGWPGLSAATLAAIGLATAFVLLVGN